MSPYYPYFANVLTAFSLLGGLVLLGAGIKRAWLYERRPGSR